MENKHEKKKCDVYSDTENIGCWLWDFTYNANVNINPV